MFNLQRAIYKVEEVTVLSKNKLHWQADSLPECLIIGNDPELKNVG